MEGSMTTPHEIVDPGGLMQARGYSHAINAAEGRTVWVAGQIAADAGGAIVGETWAEQFDVALGNVVTCLRAADAEPHHVVSMQIFTSDIAAYREAIAGLGPIYRRHMGRHFPAMALLGIAELVDVGAVVEIMATAVVPRESLEGA